jgi:hypothetical protein
VAHRDSFRHANGNGSDRVRLVAGTAYQRVSVRRKMVARLNIEHYRKVLSEEIDQTKRQTLLQLIAEEKAKLSALSPSSVM